MKRIDLPHKVCGMTCMVNGLEDLYEWKTGARLPDWLLFYVSGMAGFAYLKFKNAPVPRMVGFGSVPKRQYKQLEEIVGFRWTTVGGRSFQFSLDRAKRYIDTGMPVILGAVDMYHLPYYTQFYHTLHIPIHYLLLVGHDDDREIALVRDCDRAATQEIPYSDLERAWDVNVPGMSKRNTLFAFEFNKEIADVETIAREGLRIKAESMLNPPVSMSGITAMRKLVRELPHWPEDLEPEQLDACLRHMVEYTGFPPALPNRLTGYDAPENHAAGRDGFAGLLSRLAKDLDEPAWVQAAPLFEQSGRTLQALTEATVDAILSSSRSLAPISELLGTAADLEERAYRMLAG